MASDIPADLTTLLDAAADCLAPAEGGIDLLESLESARAVIERVRSLASRLAAIEARVVDQVDRDALFLADGHRTAACWLTHAARTSRGDAAAVVATARMLRTCDRVAKAFSIGELGVGQARALARVHRNPRCGHTLNEYEDPLLEAAASLSLADFGTVCTQWERIADEDGSLTALEKQHRDRGAKFTQQADGSWKLEGTFAPLPGKAMADILSKYVEAQRLAEADDFDLAGRTSGQRGADALYAIFMDAAATPPEARRPEPLVSLVVSEARAEAWLARTPDPGGLCETIDGVPVHRSDALAAILVGQLRRVVVDTAGVVIDLGRTSRLFRGGAREAAMLQGRARCTWLSCGRTGHTVQVDHTTDWQRGGSTSPDNNDLLCGYHNRLKQKGFRLWRDPSGTWHFYRPDGREIE